MRRSARITVALSLADVALASSSAHGADKPKVVILGFDGADARLVKQWMDEGKLPNLAQLRGRRVVLRSAADEPASDAGLVVVVRDRDESGQDADLRLG